MQFIAAVSNSCIHSFVTKTIILIIDESVMLVSEINTLMVYIQMNVFKIVATN